MIVAVHNSGIMPAGMNLSPAPAAHAAPAGFDLLFAVLLGTPAVSTLPAAPAVAGESLGMTPGEGGEFAAEYSDAKPEMPTALPLPETADAADPGAADAGWNQLVASAPVAAIVPPRQGGGNLAAAASELPNTPATPRHPAGVPAGEPRVNLPAPPAEAPAQAWNLTELAGNLSRPLAAALAAASDATGAATVAGPDADGIELAPAEDGAERLAQPGRTMPEWRGPLTPQTGIAQTRSEGLIEQVRQAQEWLAERAEGAIRLGEHGLEANLRLRPADLGGVRVQLTVSNDLAVQASFVAERAETAQALRQQLGALEQALGRHGLTLERVAVSVQPVAAGGRSENAQGQQQFSSRREGHEAQERRQGEAFHQGQQRREGQQ